MAKKRDIDVARLCGAIRSSRQALRRFREERVRAVRQLVGNNWSDDGAEGPVPINLIALYVGILGGNLIAQNPRVLLTTFDRASKPLVAAMQSWANSEIEAIALQDTLLRVVTDALFSVGICKVALAGPPDAAAANWQLGAGQPFCERVDLDDFVYDTRARDFRQASYLGHRYRVPLSTVKESKLYSSQRKDLEASLAAQYNAEGDERIAQLTRNSEGEEDDFEDMVDLWEVYLPRHRTVLTLVDDGTGPNPVGEKLEALREQAWLGPDRGPYHFLCFGAVPGNAMPKAPIQDLIDLHEGANGVLRKILRTIDRIKEVTAVGGGATEDALRINKANDGETVQVNRADAIHKMVTAGDALPIEVSIFSALKDLFVYMGGNLDALGGLSPQAKTLGQDRLLSENANRGVQGMQQKTIEMTAGVLEALCWYWHHDPFKVQRSTYSLPGLPGVSMTRQVTPQMRKQGRFEDLQIRVDPYSLAHRSPEERLGQLQQIFQSVILPLMPILQQQGITVDLNRYLQKVGEYLDMPDLAEVLTIQAPPDPETKTTGEQGSGMPAQTTRTHVRQNMPGQTREASDRNLGAAMMGISLGGNPNGQQNGMVR